MVVLGGLELVAAGYLINRHQKNKQEERRIRDEEDLLEEQRYRIHSADNAGPGHRRTHSYDRDDRKHSHRRHSHERRHSRDSRRDGRKHNYERPQNQRPYASSVPPPQYAAAAPVVQQPTRPLPSAMKPTAPMAAAAQGRPATAQPQSFPVTGWPANWEQSQRGPPPPSSHGQAGQVPPNLAPYYRDPAQSDVKYGFQDGEEDSARGRAQLRPEDAYRQGGHSGARGGSGNRNVRFDLSNQVQPGEVPPPYRP